jgi:hypothetical protein
VLTSSFLSIGRRPVDSLGTMTPSFFTFFVAEKTGAFWSARVFVMADWAVADFESTNNTVLDLNRKMS